MIACIGPVLVTGNEETHYLFLYQMLSTSINNAGTGPNRFGTFASVAVVVAGH